MIEDICKLCKMLLLKENLWTCCSLVPFYNVCWGYYVKDHPSVLQTDGQLI